MKQAMPAAFWLSAAAGNQGITIPHMPDSVHISSTTSSLTDYWQALVMHV